MLRGQGTIPTPVPLPDSPATTRYVRWDWGRFVEFIDPNTQETRFVSLAYREGFLDATTGTPLSNIILAFGRQLEDGRVTEYGERLEGWHVQLPPDLRAGVEIPDRVKNHRWVQRIAEEYMRGYNDNPAHGSTVIAIGTNNANVAWNCKNAGLVSALWRQAGQQWRELVNRIQVPGLRIRIASANDIETWALDGYTYDDETRWVACGKGTLNWFNGYESVNSDEILPVLNFGSDVLREFQQEWTDDQAFAVLSGIQSVRAHPQIYCPQWIDPLVSFARDYERGVFFYGVTSENNGNNTCAGVGSLTWQESWTLFRDALDETDELQNTLAPSVSSFCLPPKDPAKPCIRTP
jgi:hypothetical protein